MFFLFNKSKIISYLVSVFTVLALFGIANIVASDNNALQVAANTANENINIINSNNMKLNNNIVIY